MAGPAETGEFKQVVIYAEAVLPAEPSCKFGNVMPNGIGAYEVNNLAAAGANQVVVMLRRAYGVAGTAVTGAELADESKIFQYLQSAVDSNQPDAVMALTGLLVYCRWS